MTVFNWVYKKEVVQLTPRCARITYEWGWHHIECVFMTEERFVTDTSFTAL